MKILLPGLDDLLKYALKSFELKGKKTIVVGAGAEEAAKKLAKKSQTKVEVILEDYEQLISSKLRLQNEPTIICKLMDFANMDYSKGEVDFIFAQASISNSRRKFILKEFERILRPEGTALVGEVVTLKSPVPRFVKDLFDAADLNPLLIDEIKNYYENSGWEVLNLLNLSYTLKEYYRATLQQLSESIGSLSKQERSYHKKILNRMKHESNAYLKLGGDKYIGFAGLELKLKRRGNEKE